MAKSIYKSEVGRDRVLAAYDEATERLTVPNLEHRTVQTRFGETHMLVCGPVGAAPVVCFHGGNSFNAHTLAWYPDVTDQFRVYAPDTIGHPGRSAETRLSPSDLSYGEWAAEVVEALGLTRVAALGTSHGAGVILRLAAVAPRRIDKAALVVPSGLVKPTTRVMMQMVLPWLRYTLFPSRERVVRMLQPMFAGTPVDDEVADTIGLIFENVRIETGMPRPATEHELASWEAPVLVMASEFDMFFPASRVLPRAREVIPNLAGTEQIDHSGHYPSSEDRQRISERVAKFFN